MIRTRILSVVAAASMVGGAIAFAVPAGADLDGTRAGNQLVQCINAHDIVSLNPTIKDGDAKYVKAATKRSDGTKFAFLSGDPVPADVNQCDIDPGIRANQGGQDVKYLLDDQTNGQGLLTQWGATAKTSGVFTGSATCFAGVSPGKQYPNSYPLQGKLIWKFDQVNAALQQIQMQQFLRIGAIPATLSDLSVTGIVIKGPGLGGTVDASITFYPTTSVKNVDPIGCTDGVGLDAIPLNTSLAELHLYAIDTAADADADPDPWNVTIPS